MPASAQYVEQIDVAVANVDVVVTDRDGNPVRGLTRDDFTLYDDGKAQPITNFTAFDVASATATAAGGPSSPEAAAPVEYRRRLVVLFVDVDEIEPVPRQRFFDGIGRYLDAAMRPGDFLTLLHWSKRVRVALPPTSDQKVIADTLQNFARSNRWSEAELQRQMGDREIEQNQLDALFGGSASGGGAAAAFDGDAAAQFEEWASGEERCAIMKRKIREIRSLVVTLARIDLQKVLLFASDDLTVRYGTCSVKHQLDDLANTANAYGLTIHAFHPPGARDKIVLSPEATGSFSAGSKVAPGVEYGRMFEQSEGLAQLAHRTGGRLGVGPAESTDVLQRAAAELDTYYSLGYRLGPGREDKPRKIRVTVNDPTYRVRTRDTVMRLSEMARLRDRVMTNLYLPDQVSSGSLSFNARIAGVRREGRTSLADVVLTIRARDLLMLQQGGNLRGSFSVLVAAGRDLGDTSDVTELKQDFDSKGPPAEGSVITYSFTIKMRPDSRRLSIALRDNLSGEVAAKLVTLQK